MQEENQDGSIGLAELCTKIQQIMCTAFEDNAPSFCQLCKNYTHHFLDFVLHMPLYLNIKNLLN